MVVYGPELIGNNKYCRQIFQEKWTNIKEKLSTRKAHPLSDNLKDNTQGLIAIFVFLEPWGPGRKVKTSFLIYKIKTKTWSAKHASQERMAFTCCFLHQLVSLSVIIQLKPISSSKQTYSALWITRPEQYFYRHSFLLFIVENSLL